MLTKKQQNLKERNLGLLSETLAAIVGNVNTTKDMVAACTSILIDRQIYHPEDQTVLKHGVRVRLRNRTPISPCPCGICRTLIQPKDCAKGWSCRQICEDCMESNGVTPP